MNIDELISPQPKQTEALLKLFDPACKYLLYGGAMAGGKSYLLRWAALAYLLWITGKTGIRNIPVGLFSEDYPTLKDRQVARIKREFPDWIGELRDSREEGYAFHVADEYGGGRILLRNLDDPSKYMSSEFAGEFVEELTRNPELTFQDLRNRLRYPGVTEVKFMGATNPGGVGHGWVKRFWIDQDSEDPEQDRFIYVHANAYDNKYISETYIKQLESLPEQKRKAYLEGSWEIFAGQFFPEFSVNKHVINPIIPSGKYVHFGSMDWGYEAPFSFHSHIIKPEKHEGVAFNRIITFSELYDNHKTPERVGEMIGKHDLEKYSFIRCDPAMFHKVQDGSVAIIDKIKQSIPDYAALFKPANNDRIGGWAIMHNWLSIAPDGLPYWLITKNCKNLIRTLPQLVHNDNRMEDVDTTGEDHAPDDARYGLVHVKFIDAKVGGVGKTESHKATKTANIDPATGREVAMDVDKFGSAWSKTSTGVYYK